MPRPAAGPLGFYARSVGHAAAMRARTWLDRPQRYRIGRYAVTLPPAHRLPWFQDLFPTYDRYAASLLQQLLSGSRTPLLVDVGANVGDTTLLALDAVPQLHVVAVEGDAEFTSYLRDNTRQVASRVTVVDRFLSVRDQRPLQYRGNSSTGGFVPATDGDPLPMPTGLDLTVTELLADADRHDVVVWKSDTDGLDLTLLEQDWDIVLSTCDVVWFEWDPFLDLGGPDLLRRTADAIAATDRVVLVHDNLGRRLVTTPAPGARDVLLGLTSWLGEPSVPGETAYLDVWLVSPRLARRSATAASGWELGPATP
ncbi:methyltransferase, FkbM family [Nocardioides scoriae]|uniref:Methyltransferase, FkbM family n=1 Tax=Nocardioides scoriae TaxID=642780 RepID=A0A1H1MIU3_9ACTN|nr:hypothetical protein [Nocardioides scoriae]SDR86751.1 methyltransferase, FkbM family [Nocardioides scoriae]